MTAIPRPASTVVLMDSNSQIYLTKRPKTMKFMGGFFVFPGGAVEQGDHLSDGMIRTCGERNPSVNLSYYTAAARELLEEAGVLLCCKENGSAVLLPEETITEYRRLLVSGQITFWDMLDKEDLYLNLDNLRYFGNLVTPKPNKIRFDTRFFAANLPYGQSPCPSSQEIDEAYWLTAEKALTAYHAGEISLAPPTILSLLTIIDHLHGAPLEMNETLLEKILSESKFRL